MAEGVKRTVTIEVRIPETSLTQISIPPLDSGTELGPLDTNSTSTTNKKKIIMSFLVQR